MGNKTDLLGIAVRDEALSLTERRQAAEHYVAATIDAVPQPGEDDPDVISLRTPWKDDGPLGNIAPMAWRQVNLAHGWSADGPTVPQAKRYAHERLKMRALLAVVVDETAHKLERLEACRRVLEDHLHPQGHHRKNGFDAEKMLAKVLPATATKFSGLCKPRIAVDRPPTSLADVWDSL